MGGKAVDLLVGAVREVVVALCMVRPGLQRERESTSARGLGRRMRGRCQLPGALPVAALDAEARQQ